MAFSLINQAFWSILGVLHLWKPPYIHIRIIPNLSNWLNSRFLGVCLIVSFVASCTKVVNSFAGNCVSLQHPLLHDSPATELSPACSLPAQLSCADHRTSAVQQHFSDGRGLALEWPAALSLQCTANWQIGIPIWSLPTRSFGWHSSWVQHLFDWALCLCMPCNLFSGSLQSTRSRLDLKNLSHESTWFFLGCFQTCLSCFSTPYQFSIDSDVCWLTFMFPRIVPNFARLSSFRGSEMSGVLIKLELICSLSKEV